MELNPVQEDKKIKKSIKEVVTLGQNPTQLNSQIMEKNFKKRNLE